MPFQDNGEYPRGIFSTDVLTDTPQDVGTPGVDLKVSHILIRGHAAGTRVFIFRNSAGTTEYFRVSLGPAVNMVIPRGFQTTAGGLEVLTETAAGSGYVTVFYVQP
jgi:hypothetical protein